MLSDDTLQKQLQSREFFRDFTSEELNAFLHLLDPMIFEPGQVIVRQDDPGDAMFIISEGLVRVVHHRNGNYVHLAELGPGAFFGEIALVDHGPRCADVQAVEQTKVLRVNQSVIAALTGVYPSAAFKLLIALGRELVGRLRQSNQRYIDALLLPQQRTVPGTKAA